MASTVSKSILNELYSERSPGARKGDFGHLLVIGGSYRYTGAPALVALAALRAGVDRVTVAAPRRAADIVASFSPDIITVPLEGGIIAPENVGPLTKELNGKTAVVIGNGLGRDDRTLRAIMMMLERIEVPVVADADALYTIAGAQDVLRGLDVVVTPHSEEFRTVTAGTTIDDAAPTKRVNIVEEEAQKLGAVIVLKGHDDVISDGATTLLNDTGNAFMTVGGTGDVLAGVIGALVARGSSSISAAAGGAWIVGQSGNLASKKRADSLLASDLLDEISNVLMM